MSTAAYAPKQPRGAHARANTPPEIHVIPGGLLTSELTPRPAKTRLRDTLSGTRYNLTPRDRTLALCASILFTLITLATMLV